MHKITDDQIDFILDDIYAKGIKTEEVRYDLLDHICCVIEHEMPENGDFYKFYEYILPRFFKESLREIQDETELLLKFKDYYTMKKSLYISGLASAILTLAGATLKTLHLPGAGIMIVLGVVLFALLFLPLMIALKFRDDESITDKIVFSFGLLLGMTTSLGILFKLMHWPYANLLMLSGLTLFVFGYTPLYFVTRIRRPDQKFQTTVNTVLLMATGGLLYGMYNLGYSKNMQESYQNAYAYVEHNEQNIKSINEAFYAEVSNAEEVLEVRKATTALDQKVEEIKKHLVQKIEGHTMKEGESYSSLILTKPKEMKLVHELFESSSDEWSKESLLKAISAYNVVLKTVAPTQKAMVIDTEKLPLNNLNLELLLQELTQLQLQIAHTENSFLSYQLALKK
ncbi:hypothetical protein [Parvicella tangerina]|uniref:Uncharacterized protein n=1 Tax=Parvicella tangerina TaxID=2829795 RepID=A0A916NKL1_9FLAO|nr:hypothetical protein [Parvicella tangerina]CAG5087852.1 hypothetical protein CRYO30217_03599 [Parvicella tangerina]